MRFLAAVWMGCSSLAASRAWAAWRFQKAGSSSSTGQGESGGQVSLGGVSSTRGAAGRHLVTWDDAKGQLWPQAQQQKQHPGSLHGCGMAGVQQGGDSGEAGTLPGPERRYQPQYKPPGLKSGENFVPGCKRPHVPPIVPGGHPDPTPCPVTLSHAGRGKWLGLAGQASGRGSWKRLVCPAQDGPSCLPRVGWGSGGTLG